MDTPPTPQPSQKESLSELITEYGPVALVIYFCLFGVVLVSFAWAIRRGFGDSIDQWMQHSWLARVGSWLPGSGGHEAATSAVGTWGAAYVATKLTTPVRLAVTIALTRLFGAWRRRSATQSPLPEDPSVEEPSSRG